MDFKGMYEAQKVFRSRIDYKGSDRFEKLILALQVELGECANEWRGFKFWSKNINPSNLIHTTAGATPENAVYFKCMSEEDCGEYSSKEDFVSLLKDLDYEVCPKCHVDNVYSFREQNPLLEEYVDGLHFILELGIEIYFEDFEMIYRLSEVDRQRPVTSQFRRIFFLVSMLDKNKSAITFIELISEYLILGELLEFSFEEIEEAYYQKNAVNHNRQNEGY